MTWNIGEADSAQLEVAFVVFLQREGIIGGGAAGMRRLVHCTIVKPDMIMHLPAEQDENEPPVTGWTDTDGNGIRAPSDPQDTCGGGLPAPAWRWRKTKIGIGIGTRSRVDDSGRRLGWTSTIGQGDNDGRGKVKAG